MHNLTTCIIVASCSLKYDQFLHFNLRDAELQIMESLWTFAWVYEGKARKRLQKNLCGFSSFWWNHLFHGSCFWDYSKKYCVRSTQWSGRCFFCENSSFCDSEKLIDSIFNMDDGFRDWQTLMNEPILVLMCSWTSKKQFFSQFSNKIRKAFWDIKMILQD